jgi:hypothetical protein
MVTLRPAAAFSAMVLCACAFCACARREVESVAPGTVVGVAPNRVHGPYVPAGAFLTIALGRPLSTASVPGEPFTATVESALVGTDGRVAVPAGATLWGHVVSTREGGSPRIVLSFDTVQTTLGPAPIVAAIVNVVEAAEPPAEVESHLLAAPRTPQPPAGGPEVTDSTAVSAILLPSGVRMRLELTRSLFPPGTVFTRP